MTVMIRKKGKAKKIAYSILGVPDNIRFSKSVFSENVRKRIVFDGKYAINR